MKWNGMLILLLMVVLVAFVGLSGCLDKDTDKNTTPIIPSEEPFVKAEMVGSFSLIHSDFYNNSSHVIYEDGNKNRVEWIIRGNNNTHIQGGYLKVNYYDEEQVYYIEKSILNTEKSGRVTFKFAYKDDGYLIQATSGKTSNIMASGTF